jgi:hypothetical protein
MKTKTENKEEIQRFKYFYRSIVNDYDEYGAALLGTLQFSAGSLSYETYSKKGKFTLLNDVLYFEGHRRSFNGVISSESSSFTPFTGRWKIIETSRPDLQINEFNSENTDINAVCVN